MGTSPVENFPRWQVAMMVAFGHGILELKQSLLRGKKFVMSAWASVVVFDKVKKVMLSFDWDEFL